MAARRDLLSEVSSCAPALRASAMATWAASSSARARAARASAIFALACSLKKPPTSLDGVTGEVGAADELGAGGGCHCPLCALSAMHTAASHTCSSIAAREASSVPCVSKS